MADKPGKCPIIKLDQMDCKSLYPSHSFPASHSLKDPMQGDTCSHSFSSKVTTHSLVMQKFVTLLYIEALFTCICFHTKTLSFCAISAYCLQANVQDAY